MNINPLTLTLLTWTIWRAHSNSSKWRMGFNSAFKGLMLSLTTLAITHVITHSSLKQRQDV